jgi:hypothetical protein
MRVRASRGLQLHTFHGNFFVRSTDLLALPNVSPDIAFAMQVSYCGERFALAPVFLHKRLSFGHYGEVFFRNGVYGAGQKRALGARRFCCRKTSHCGLLPKL